jgi:hypothetical protein
MPQRPGARPVTPELPVVALGAGAGRLAIALPPVEVRRRRSAASP